MSRDTVWGRVFAFDESPRGVPFRIASTPDLEGFIGPPDLCVHASGGFLVVWQKSDQLLARDYIAPGLPRTGVVPIAVLPEPVASHPAVVWAVGEPEWLYGTPYRWAVWSRRFSASGQPVGAAAVLSPGGISTDPQLRIALSSGDEGRLGVVWAGAFDGTDRGVYANHLDASRIGALRLGMKTLVVEEGTGTVATSVLRFDNSLGDVGAEVLAIAADARPGSDYGLLTHEVAFDDRSIGPQKALIRIAGRFASWGDTQAFSG